MSKKSKLDRSLPPPEPLALPVPVIDNHTHMDSFPGSLAQVVTGTMDAAERVGVKAAVHVGCDVASSQFTVKAVQEDARLLGAVAIHPNDAARLAEREELTEALNQIASLAEHERIRAIGETGLDYFRTPPEGHGYQQEAFRWHINLAKKLGKALQIHDRDAHADIVRILQEEGPPETVVFHCFSGDSALAEICNQNGWYMSFSGTITFKNNDDLRQALSVALPELVLVETDAPYLTPHPYRGQPNAPYMIPYTVRVMQEVRGGELADFCTQLTSNTEAVYGVW